MTINVDVSLEQLHCNRETEHGGSSPYLWVTLLQIDDDTLSSEGQGANTVGWSRGYLGVLAEGMRTGDSLTLPGDMVEGPGASFRAGLKTGAALVVAVALWDRHDTLANAVEAGFETFVSSIRLQVGDMAEGYVLAGDPEHPAAVTDGQQRIIDDIKTYVSNDVHRAIKAALGSEDELHHLDTPIDTGFISFISYGGFDQISSAPFAVSLASHPDHAYEIFGQLNVSTPVGPVGPPPAAIGAGA